ncbi:hypothetical protein EVAR_16126_1 [Eumeta japonica]|uniref:Uncharacterized protein n=1 Tax=Eumeta variegata TaxID=151549 RepID=A0A4C1UJW2_EUMVA|nr:hypothetical protein EVAR_16126_1 [Eumeta japonica]
MQTPSYYDLKQTPNRCAPCAPGTPLGDSDRAKSPRDFLCRDAHLVVSIGQSRADGIPCRSTAIDEVLKAPIYWGYRQQLTDILLRSIPFIYTRDIASPSYRTSLLGYLETS